MIPKDGTWACRLSIKTENSQEKTFTFPLTTYKKLGRETGP